MFTINDCTPSQMIWFKHGRKKRQKQRNIQHSLLSCRWEIIYAAYVNAGNRRRTRIEQNGTQSFREMAGGRPGQATPNENDEWSRRRSVERRATPTRLSPSRRRLSRRGDDLFVAGSHADFETFRIPTSTSKRKTLIPDEGGWRRWWRCNCAAVKQKLYADWSGENVELASWIIALAWSVNRMLLCGCLISPFFDT